MTDKELEKIRKKIEFKENCGIAPIKEYSEIFREAAKISVDYLGVPEPVPSIGFIGTKEQKLDFYKSRLKDIYDSLSKNLYDNEEFIIKKLLVAYEDLSIVIMQLSDGKIGDETSDPFFTEASLHQGYGMDMTTESDICIVRAKNVYDYIYKYIPYLLSSVTIDNLAFANTVTFIMDGAFMIFEYNFICGLHKDKNQGSN